MKQKQTKRRKTGPTANPEIAALATQIGDNIGRLRRQRHLTQVELARRIQMPPPAYNVIEKGMHVPAGRTMYLLAKALGVTPNDLFSVPSPDDATPIVWLPESESESYEPLPHLAKLARAYLTLEDLCGAPKRPSLSLHPVFEISEKGMSDLAAMVRLHLGVTHAVIFDYLELLENAGLRILFCDLPEKQESLAAYDSLHANAFIFISRKLAASPERQLFRLIYELGRILLHTRRGDTGIRIRLKRNSRMAKFFAGHFLMPESAVRATVRRLGIEPDRWDFGMLCRVKTRFGVSAESFLYTLNDLKLIQRGCSEAIKKQLFAHYEARHHAEPGDRFRHLNPNAAFLDLLHIAQNRAQTDPEVAAEVAGITSLIKKHGQPVAKQCLRAAASPRSRQAK